MALAGRWPAHLRHRRRVAQCPDVEDGHRLVRREGDRDGHGHLRQLLANRNCIRTLRIAGGGRQLGADRKLSPHPRYAGCRHGAAGSALSLAFSTGGRACIGDLAGWRSAAGRHRRR